MTTASFDTFALGHTGFPFADERPAFSVWCMIQRFEARNNGGRDGLQCLGPAASLIPFHATGDTRG